MIDSREGPHKLSVSHMEALDRLQLAETSLKTIEFRLETAQTIADVGSWELDIGSGLVWASDQAFRIYGIRQESSHLSFEMIYKVVCAEDRAMMDSALKQLIGKNEKYDVKFKIKRAEDSCERIMHSVAVVSHDENGKPTKVLGTIQDITEIEMTKRELLQTNSLLQATLQSTADGILAVNPDGSSQFYNEQFIKIWGLPAEITAGGDDGEIIRFMKNKIVNPETFFPDISEFSGRIEAKGFEEFELKDGRALEIYTFPQWCDGKVAGRVLSFRDISERKRWEKALVASEAKHKAMIANISDRIAVIDINGKVKYKSPNLENWFGWSQEDFMDAEPWTIVHPDDMEYIRREFWKLLQKDGTIKTVEFRYKCRDGSYKYVNLTGVNLIHDVNIQGVLVNFHDISESRAREKEIRYLNYHDVLTGLYNRAFFEDAIKRLDSGLQLPLSIIMGDINGLKLINDAFGHADGDKLLKQIAKILTLCCRSGDIAARIGGDEFCILLPRTSADAAQSICRNIYKECENYVSKTDRKVFYLSISLGYDTKLKQDTRIESVFKTAEEHMYKRKLLERKSMHSSIISAIKTALYVKSRDTQEHAERLIGLSGLLGRALNLEDAQMNELELLSSLLDIGKMSISDNILNKTTPLTNEEWIEIRKHPETGYRIAQASPELFTIADYILCHHERWDGKGYPQGLQGEDIPLLSRIIAVVDSFDAMTHDRPYRKAMPVKVVIDEIVKNAGAQFDPQIAMIFVKKALGLGLE